MPNWCFCKLTVYGPSEEVNRFANEASTMLAQDEDERSEISLQKLVPCPPILLGRDHAANPDMDMAAYLASMKSGANIPLENDDWYTWRVRNWGTKWDITAKIEKLGPQLKNGKRELVYTFDSAWSPPCAAFERISEDWPLLKFRLTYREEGMGVKGSETFGPHPENAVDKNSVA